MNGETVLKKMVDIYIPKFTFNSNYSMVETLQKMGISKAFIPVKANFSGIDGTKNLFIGNVIHQAFIDVNEEKTEAATATGIIMVENGLRSVTTFRANHPFIFIIQDRNNGNILFLGRVSNPKV